MVVSRCLHQLMFQWFRQAPGEKNHTSLVALGLVDVEPALFEVEVLDPQVKGFADEQAAGVEQMNNEAGGIVVNIGNDRKQLADFLLSRTMADASGLFGEKGIDWPELEFENVAVKAKQGVESLVLSGS